MRAPLRDCQRHARAALARSGRVASAYLVLLTAPRELTLAAAAMRSHGTGPAMAAQGGRGRRLAEGSAKFKNGGSGIAYSSST
jgi:hypothetical protein